MIKLSKVFIFTLVIPVLNAAAAYSQDPFSDAAQEQTNRSYTENPASINSDTKTFKSSMEALRMNSEQRGLEGLTVTEKSNDSTVYAPMAGFADTLFSKAHANQLGVVLASPMVLYNTTLQLTEPAVAAGLNNSVSQGYGSLHTRYLAEDNYMKQLERDPETKQIMQRAYSQCVANLIRDRATSATEDKIGWIEAQSICMADRVKSIESVSGSGKNFNDLGGKDVAVGFDFNFDRSWDISAGDKHLIRLSDYILKESNVESLGGASLDEYRNAFANLLGDYVFELDTAQGNAGRSASRELKYHLEAAKTPRQEWLKDRSLQNYGTLMGLLGDMCVKRAVDPDKSSLDGNSFCQAAAQKGGSTLRRQFVSLSFVGYEFNCSMLESLFMAFSWENPQTNGASTQQDCSIFMNPMSYEDLVSFDGKGAPAATAKTAHTYVINLVGEISIGQMYLVVMNINQVIDNLTNVNAYFAKTFATQLVKNFVGEQDLYSSYTSIINNIKSLKVNIEQYNSLGGNRGSRFRLAAH